MSLKGGVSTARCVAHLLKHLSTYKCVLKTCYSVVITVPLPRYTYRIVFNLYFSKNTPSILNSIEHIFCEPAKSPFSSSAPTYRKDVSYINNLFEALVDVLHFCRIHKIVFITESCQKTYRLASAEELIRYSNCNCFKESFLACDRIGYTTSKATIVVTVVFSELTRIRCGILSMLL